MQLLSVNVGLPREVEWQGRTVRTSIWKTPVPGRVRLDRLNLEGNGQADLSVHGGPDKAAYAYPSEHYAYWRGEMPGMDLPTGVFGENLTIAGLLEDEVHIGDRFRVGTAEVMVTQPRMPCHKLGIRFGRADMVKRFLQSGRCGFYLAVISEGEVAAGDPIARLSTDERRFAVPAMFALRIDERADAERLRAAIALPALAASWREHFRERLARLGGA